MRYRYHSRINVSYMIRNLVILFFLHPFFCNPVSAQRPPEMPEEDYALIQEYEDTLGVLSFAILRDTSASRRFASCKKMIPTLVQALKIPYSFDYSFPQLQSISIQYPADSSFRIITWQLFVDDNDYRYYGAIQMNEPELELHPLIDRSYEIMDVEQAVLPNDRWYGVLYYNVKAFEDEQGPGYLLFGMDGYSFFRRRKVVDVLRFVEDKPVFGHPVFVEQPKPDSVVVRKRLLFEYGAQAAVHVNFDEGQRLLFFDHLIRLEGYAKQGDVMVPDGSYEGYRFEDGAWRHISKLFTQTQEEPPREEPVLQGREGKDLFGKEKKQK